MDTDPPADWADLIRRKRTARQMSQAALADAIGVTRPAVSLWEAGTGTPNTVNVRRLVAELDITDAELAAMYREVPA